MQNRSNIKYQKLLQTLKSNNYEIYLCDSLKDLLNGNFVEIDGCIYYENLAPEGPFSKELHDRTGNEAFYNKIQIDDYCNEGGNYNRQVLVAEKFIHLLSVKLNTMYNNYSFKIILSCDNNFCNITFHLIRPFEEYLTDDLEDYTMEAILEITTN